MARFRVLWNRPAVDSLAAMWNDAADRQAIADAANAIDDELSVNPASRGSELSEGLRVLMAPPLRVLFEVSDEDRTAKIVGVRLLSKR